MAQVKAYRLADNRTHEDAEWDEELLAIELSELEEQGFDLDLTGFEAIEWEKLIEGINDNEGMDADSVPDLPEEAITKPGDMWLLGEHRLICGDSTKAETMKALMGDEIADMVFTDPPYNVDYGKGRKIKNDNLGSGFYQFLFDACTQMMAVCKGAFYICMSSSELHTLHQAFTQSGGKWSTFIIWAKNCFTLGRSDYQRQYEPILYGWKEGKEHYWCGVRDQGDVWHYDKPQSNDIHPTMKPVELVCRAIQHSSKPADIVLDPFGGSGTTLIACEQLKRRARLIELDPLYCDVMVKRWEELSGKKAMLSDENKTFAEVAKGER